MALTPCWNRCKLNCNNFILNGIRCALGFCRWLRAICGKTCVLPTPQSEKAIAPFLLLRRTLRVLIPYSSKKRTTHQKVSCSFWLGNRDSNHNKKSQSMSCYRYTIPQRTNLIIYFFLVKSRIFLLLFVFFLVLLKIILVISKHLCYYVFCLGGVAQLGERLNGIQEVMGSIPTVSTKKDSRKTVFFYPSRRLGISSRVSVYIIAIRRMSSPQVYTPTA